jgi:hypothetical protein
MAIAYTDRLMAPADRAARSRDGRSRDDGGH